MSFSAEWETIYQNNTHMSIWPWSDVVSYVNRYAKRSPETKRVLEIGCGAGANIPFFLKGEWDYHSIEGSSTIVELLHLRYPSLVGRIVAGDFTQTLPFDGDFDLVLDRCSLTHNTTTAMKAGLALIFQQLRPGGKFIAIDWFSLRHAGVKDGEAIDDYTRYNKAPATLGALGMVHFSDEEHLKELITGVGFILERLEHKEHTVTYPENQAPLAWWNIVAVKP